MSQWKRCGISGKIVHPDDDNLLIKVSFGNLFVRSQRSQIDGSQFWGFTQSPKMLA